MKSFCRLVFAVMLAICTGCSSTGSSSNSSGDQSDWDSASRTGFVARAVVCGLTAVDPDAYGGWDGECPGCDVDAETFGLMCRESGVDTRIFHNAEATADAVIAAARSAWDGMQAGDLLVIFVSGHGGQLDDDGGDEGDGQDETICLWDGELKDDTLAELWDEVPAGVRVFFVTDTCNSGTNFKYRPRSFKRSLPREFSGALIHYGGCADGESSYGSESGGTFTTALVDGWAATNSYAVWFLRAAASMPRNQIPAYEEFGNVGDEFRNAEVFK